MRGTCVEILIVLLPLSARTYGTSGCVSTVKALRVLAGAPLFSSRWAEVSMDDGKPLVASNLERNGALSRDFEKTGEGLHYQINQPPTPVAIRP